MNLERVTAGKDVPEAVNVIIEIPSSGDPVKYEVDKESGAMFVDRFMSTAMRYPCNYGYVPQTLADDGDPVDVLVLSPFQLITGSVISVRPVGMLAMTDEKGDDSKILAVPVDSISTYYSYIKSPEDVQPIMLNTIKHFFEHYKDLEKGKWVKVNGWENVGAAHEEILSSIKRYQDNKQ
ncbi:MAG: ppa [Gammaproteobacteria bacterium]|jgi:inorganic pyrophosphatase|nr:ppa [Gammaproteobacteria bacterium]